MRYGTKHKEWIGYLTAEERGQFDLAEDRHRWHKDQAKPWEEIMVRLEIAAKERRSEARKASGYVRKVRQGRPIVQPLTEGDVLIAMQMLEMGHGINAAAVATGRTPRGLSKALKARGLDPADAKTSAAKLCKAIQAVRSGRELSRVAKTSGIDLGTLTAAVRASKEHDKTLIFAQSTIREAAE